MTRAPRLALRLLALAALGLLLGGCGFHLRGVAQLPAAMSRTYLAGASMQNPVVRSLAQALRANGVTLVSDPQQAGAVLTIVSINTTQRALTVSALNQATSYALETTLVFRAHATQGRWKLPDQSISVQRQYSLSTAQLQSQGPEERLLQQSMTRELANLALLRLQAHAGAS
ncbi:LPS-assembly lipoprotein LptE [Acidihalobacter prosperus]|uniref:LPS-assembly lipoprotein LptE n=1 Tax=Acidihalobacter prosperus TaxID=160660 RepID=A0A1A6C5W3_9GAMM|nr:hypothetical protein [Acidihalobacter prosperus]OBS09966.1 hypothetical protein Thpro_021016 [Acidihalobacter prosperus]